MESTACNPSALFTYHQRNWTKYIRLIHLSSSFSKYEHFRLYVYSGWWLQSVLQWSRRRTGASWVGYFCHVPPHVDHSSQILTLFEGLPAQKGRVFNALFEPQGPENHTLFSGTYPGSLPNREWPPPPSPLPPSPQDVTFAWVSVLSVVVTTDHW